ncbi:hypothetical protein V8C37DRAFT_389231 [Trichoderma ceciliae]
MATDSWQLHHRAQSLLSPISHPETTQDFLVSTTQSGTRTGSKSLVSRQLQYPPINPHPIMYYSILRALVQVLLLVPMTT